MTAEQFPGSSEDAQPDHGTKSEVQKVHVIAPGVRPPVFSGEKDHAREGEDLRPVVIVDREDLPVGEVEIVPPEGIIVKIREPRPELSRIILRRPSNT